MELCIMVPEVRIQGCEERRPTLEGREATFEAPGSRSAAVYFKTFATARVRAIMVNELKGRDLMIATIVKYPMWL